MVTALLCGGAHPPLSDDVAALAARWQGPPRRGVPAVCTRVGTTGDARRVVKRTRGEPTENAR